MSFLKVRIAIMATLIWLAARIAPKPLTPLSTIFPELVAGLRGELAMGRTFGVVTAVWATEEGGLAKGKVMQCAAILALSRTRAVLTTASRMKDEGGPADDPA